MMRALGVYDGDTTANPNMELRNTHLAYNNVLFEMCVRNMLSIEEECARGNGSETNCVATHTWG